MHANDEVLDHKNNWLPTFGKHAIIDVTVDRFIVAPPKESFSFRNLKTSLNDWLSCCNWENMTTIETNLKGALHNLNSNLNRAIDKLAPVKTIRINNKYAPRLGPELRQLIDKRNATHRRYKGRTQWLDEFLRLSNEVDLRITQERDSFLHKQRSAVLDENKDIWMKMHNLGLLPKRKKEDHHGFTPGQLNSNFAGISVSSLENLEDAMDISYHHYDIIMTAQEEGFSFKPVNINDVVLAITHFCSQARRVVGIPQSVVVEALPVIGNYIT